MKSSQRDVGAAAARLFSAAAPLLFSRHPLSAVASTVRLATRQQAMPASAMADVGSGRFWYYVAPQAGSHAWAVMFEGQPRSYGYEALEEALKAACRAAEAMYRRHHTAAGVRVRVGEDWMEAVKFGSPPAARPQ